MRGSRSRFRLAHSRTYRSEDFGDVCARLGRGLHEEESVFVCVRLRVLRRDGPLALQIELVAYQCDHNVWARLALQLLDPRLGARKRLLQPPRGVRAFVSPG